MSTEAKQEDYLNHLLGQYIGISINDPSSYPKESFLTKAENEAGYIATTDSQRQAMARLKYGKK